MSLASSTAKGAKAATAVSTSPIGGSFSDITAVHARALRSCGARRAKSKGRRSVGAGVVAAEAPGFAASGLPATAPAVVFGAPRAAGAGAFGAPGAGGVALALDPGGAIALAVPAAGGAPA